MTVDSGQQILKLLKATQPTAVAAPSVYVVSDVVIALNAAPKRKPNQSKHKTVLLNPADMLMIRQQSRPVYLIHQLKSLHQRPKR